MTTDNRTNEPTKAQVEAAAKALYEVRPNGDIAWDSAKFDDWMEREDYRVKARAALEAADAVMKRVDEAGNEHQKCLGCGRYVDECCLTPDERMARARAKGVEFVKEADPVVTEGRVEEALYKAFQGWDEESDDLFAVQARAVMMLFRGGAK